MKLYIIRHGETDWNAAKRIQGHTDVPLNENGIRQAENAAVDLAKRDLHIKRLYSSELGRAKHTADIFGKALGLENQAIPGLQEIFCGEWEGTDWTRAKLEDERVHAFFTEAKPEAAPPGGETNGHALKRVINILREIVLFDEGDAAVVTHGGVMRNLVKHLPITWFEDAPGPYLGNCFVAVIDGKDVEDLYENMSRIPG